MSSAWLLWAPSAGVGKGVYMKRYLATQLVYVDDLPSLCTSTPLHRITAVWALGSKQQGPTPK